MKGVTVLVAAVSAYVVWDVDLYGLYTLIMDAPVYCPRPDRTDTSNPSCFFSSNYFDARSKFRNHARLAGAELVSLPVVEAEDLTIDVAVFSGAKESLVLHLSGTHGTEGFIGSAIQSAWLRNRTMHAQDDSSTQPTIIMVHALNPFGMANWRRWNEDGIDLNRNCMLTSEEWEAVKSRDADIAGYESVVEPLINLKTPPTLTTRIALFVNMARTILSGGMTTFKKALVSATYSRNTGLFYGGRGLSKSHSAFTNYLKTSHSQLVANVQKLTIVDVHSGLGPMGKDTMIVDTGSMGEAERIFTGTSQISPPYDIQDLAGSQGSGGAADGYDLVKGTTTKCYAGVFKAATSNALAVAQEFGTFPAPVVLMAMAEENMAWHHSTPPDRLPYSQAIHRVFAPAKQSFYEATMARGLLVLEQALRR